MPVFETGAFNHSATCPAASQLIRGEGLVQPARELNSTLSTGWRVALITKEILEQSRALFRQHTGADFWPMVQARVT